jgi:holo-[acyl-carrier protein] synthase
MIRGIGFDLIDVARVERELREGGDAFAERVFTPGEIAYCESKRYPAPHYAARFAAKEAAFKALAIEARDALPWQDVEIEVRDRGSPHLVLHGRARTIAAGLGVAATYVTLTHTRELAAASVVLATDSNR